MILHTQEPSLFTLTELVYKIVKIMEYKGWRNLNRSKPPINELVELQHMITGIGAPEREGWVSVGRMRENGIFSIKQNASKTVDFRPPTHWRALKE